MHLKDLPKIEAVLKHDGKNAYVVMNFESLKKFIQKCNPEGQIDESAYMKLYPDIAAAVRDKKMKSATQHFINAGYVENRSAKILAPGAATAPKAPGAPVAQKK